MVGNAGVEARGRSELTCAGANIKYFLQYPSSQFPRWGWSFVKALRSTYLGFLNWC